MKALQFIPLRISYESLAQRKCTYVCSRWIGWRTADSVDGEIWRVRFPLVLASITEFLSGYGPFIIIYMDRYGKSWCIECSSSWRRWIWQPKFNHHAWRNVNRRYHASFKFQLSWAKFSFPFQYYSSYTICITRVVFDEYSNLITYSIHKMS